MFASKIRAAVVVTGASLALSACMMPYGGVGVGYGNGGYYGGYGGYGDYGYDPYYSSGYGYGSPYGGWYDSYYYPGSGYYVYGRDGSRHRWSDAQRRYWETHRRERDNKPSVTEVLSRPFEHRVRDGATTTSSTPSTATSTGTRKIRTWSGSRSSTGTRSWGNRDTRSTSSADRDSNRTGMRVHRSRSAGQSAQDSADKND